jgi:hypothetical protein
VKNRLLPEGVALATAHQKLRLEIAQQLASDRPDAARCTPWWISRSRPSAPSPTSPSTASWRCMAR